MGKEYPKGDAVCTRRTAETEKCDQIKYERESVSAIPKGNGSTSGTGNLDPLRKYPDPAAQQLTDAIADFYGLKPEQVFVGVGSDDVLAMCFLTFFNSQKPILFPGHHLFFL